jgi:hypothetical protein
VTAPAKRLEEFKNFLASPHRKEIVDVDGPECTAVPLKISGEPTGPLFGVHTSPSDLCPEEGENANQDHGGATRPNVAGWLPRDHAWSAPCTTQPRVLRR